jgi:hypothetical protein
MFVTIACGAISGWHSIVSSSGTARQLENEMDTRPVGGVMFVATAVNRLSPILPRIIPGDWGKTGPGWLVQFLSDAPEGVRRGRIHQFLWRRSRAVSLAKKELCGQER